MSVSPASRVNYFDRQFIRLAELRDEQAYHIQLRRRHSLSHHSWGIVMGLDLVHEQDGRPALERGLAIDGYGRELLRLDRRVIGREIFDRYGTSRLDLWLEYQLDFADDRLAPVECGGGDPRRRYRAIERAQLVFTRGGARPDPRRPPGVPPEALEEPLLATPDDPRRRWPVYLGRIIMDLPASGSPTFEIDTTDRVYLGLNAEIVDHPGTAARMELGRRPPDVDSRMLGRDEFRYTAGADRDFAIFVPDPDNQGEPLQPALAVYPAGTQIRGSATVHGNVVLDGASLQFPDAIDLTAAPPATDDHPAIYRASSAGGDELRIDMGSLNTADRRLVLGVTKDGKFHPALEVSFPAAAGATTSPVVTIHGDLRIEGIIKSNDVRTRTVTEEVAALLTGMVQAGIATGA
jgi:hypothetical protein